MKMRLACAVIAAVLGSLVGGNAPARAAGGDVTVLVTSPTSAQDLHGNVPIVAHITNAPVGATATAHIGGAYTPTRTRVATLTLPDECAGVCDVTIPVDTTTWSDPGADPQAADPMLKESDFFYATVSVSSADVVVTSEQSEYFFIHNYRPTIYVHSHYGEVRAYRGSADLTISFDTVLGGSSSIGRVDVTLLLGGGTRRDYSFPVPDAAQTTGTITPSIDTSDIPDGMYSLRAVARTSDGTASDMSVLPFSVYAGPRITVTGLRARPASEDPASTKRAVATVTISRGPGYTYVPKSVAIFRDGLQVEAGVLDVFPSTCVGEVCVDHQTLEIPIYADPIEQWLTVGKHTLRAVFTENRATFPLLDSAEGTAAFDIGGVTATTEVVGPVVEGRSGTLRAHLVSVATPGEPAAEVVSWEARGAWGGSMFASGTASGTDAVVDVPLAKMGWARGEVEIFVTGSDGVTRRVSRDAFPVTRVSTVRLGAPGKVAYGARASISVGAQYLTNEAIAGARVTLQSRVLGTTAWTDAASVIIGPLGATYSMPFTANTQLRAVLPGSADHWTAGESTIATVHVAARVTLSGLPAKAVRGRAYVVTAAVLPAAAGRTVTFLTRVPGGAWRTLATVRTDRYGTARATLKAPRGTAYLRAVAAVSISSDPGSSATVTSVAR